MVISTGAETVSALSLAWAALAMPSRSGAWRNEASTSVGADREGSALFSPIPGGIISRPSRPVPVEAANAWRRVTV
ncbi:MAG: hypothetical protein NW703_02785 [Nitrospiraceae bacterium]